jgi:DnaJ-related protein SCJ1
MLTGEQKKQIYDRHGEEGLKAHEGGQHQYANPFDMFSQFFGGGCTYTIIIGFRLLPPHLTYLLHAVQAQDQVRRGPTSVSEFEVSLADVYKGASIDVRPFHLLLSPIRKKKGIYKPILTFVHN